METLLARCGFDSKDRTRNSHPGWMKEHEACLAFVRGAYARNAASCGMESIIWLPDAESIALSGCADEGLGEACRWAAYDALKMYAGLTKSGQHAEDWAEAVRRYLDRGCALGDKEACTLLAAGVESRARDYREHCQ
jgi:hypothetical protein